MRMVFQGSYLTSKRENRQVSGSSCGDVQHNNVPVVLADLLKRLADVFRFAELGPLELLCQNFLQALSHHWMIICNQDPHDIAPPATRPRL